MHMQSKLKASFRIVLGTATAQAQMTRHNIEDFYPVIAIPLVGLAPIVIFMHAGRSDLVVYAFVSIVIMTIGQMGLFTGSESVSYDRRSQILELIVASPASYFTLLATRTLVLTSIGNLGILIGWIFANIFFAAQINVFYPGVFISSVLMTTLATTGLSIITSALFSLAKNIRTFQNAVNGPLYLLGGVLVPVTFLPDWIQTASPFVFFYWSAGLMRDALQPAVPEHVLLRLSVIFAFALVAAGIGALLIRHMLTHLRREGTLGLVD